MGRNNNSWTPSWGAAIALCLALILLVAPPGGALAQGGGESITYGSSVIGSLTAESPFVIYTFNANPGDLISLVLAGLAPEVVPESSLLGPDQRQLALTSNDPFSVGSQLARLDYRIMQGGIHSLIVNNANNTPGEFLLLLNGRPGGEATGIAVGSTQTANLPPNTAPGLFSFPASPDSPLTLSLSTSTAGFSFLARVYDPNGNLIAGLAGEALRGVSLNVAPGSGEYVVEIGSLTPNVQGAIMVALTQGSASQPVTGPVPTEEPAEPPGTTPSVCQASSTLNVNVRSGPSTDYPAFGSLAAGTALTVVGRNSTTTWYVVDYNGRQGWVANSVVQVERPVRGAALRRGPAAARHRHPAADRDAFRADGGLPLDRGRWRHLPGRHVLHLLLDRDQRAGRVLRWRGRRRIGPAGEVPDRLAELHAARGLQRRLRPRVLDPGRNHPVARAARLSPFDTEALPRGGPLLAAPDHPPRPLYRQEASYDYRTRSA